MGETVAYVYERETWRALRRSNRNVTQAEGQHGQRQTQNEFGAFKQR